MVNMLLNIAKFQSEKEKKMKTATTIAEAVRSGQLIHGEHYINLKIEDSEVFFPKELTGHEEDQKIALKKDDFLCKVESYQGQTVIVSRKFLPTRVGIRGITAWKNYKTISNDLCKAISPKCKGVIHDVKALDLEFIKSVFKLTEEEIGLRKMNEEEKERAKYLLREEWSCEEIDELIPLLSACYIRCNGNYKFISEDPFYGGGYWYELADRKIELDEDFVRFETLWCADMLVKIKQLYCIRRRKITEFRTFFTHRFVAVLNDEAEITNLLTAKGNSADPFEIEI